MPTRVSERMWRGRYDRWKASGLSMSEFATKERVKKGSWTWWIRRLEKFEQDEAANMTFVRVTNGEVQSVPTVTLEIIMPNSIRLRVPSDAPMVQIAQIVMALGEIQFR